MHNRSATLQRAQGGSQPGFTRVRSLSADGSVSGSFVFPQRAGVSASGQLSRSHEPRCGGHSNPRATGKVPRSTLGPPSEALLRSGRVDRFVELELRPLVDIGRFCLFSMDVAEGSPVVLGGGVNMQRRAPDRAIDGVDLVLREIDDRRLVGLSHGRVDQLEGVFEMRTKTSNIAGTYDEQSRRALRWCPEPLVGECRTIESNADQPTRSSGSL